ncbi:GNAT family N-acetyltransferase [Roseivirga echinicomitans]
MMIQEQETESKGSFYYEKEGKRLAEMTFSKAGSDKIIIDHTTVNDSLKGTGMGGKLVEYAVDYARKHKVKIIPLCTFAKAKLERNPAWNDVL